MIQFITSVLDFIDLLVGDLVDIMAFVPKVFSYISYFIGLMPSFVAPVLTVALSILVFNRISKVF